MRRLVTMSVVLLPVTLFALLAVSARVPGSDAGSTSTASSSQGQAAADLALRAWLGSDPAPIPGGYIVSWEGATANRPQTADDSFGSTDKVTFPTEIDTFVVADGADRMYRASVLVALDPAGGSQVIGSPSIVPVPDTRGSGVAEDAAWGAMQPGPISDEIQSAVTAWAEAFTSDDGAKLRLAVGDQDASHTYLTMPMLSGAQANAVRGVLVPTGDPKKPATQMVVRVDLTLTGDQRAGGGQTSTNASYDLLVDHYDTGAPVVVAWGAPGSGPTLVPYANSLPADVPRVTVQSPAPAGTTEPTADVSAGSAAEMTDDATSTGVEPVGSTAPVTEETGQ